MVNVVAGVPYEMYLMSSTSGWGKTGTSDLFSMMNTERRKNHVLFYDGAIDDPNIVFCFSRSSTTDTHSSILVEYTAGIMIDLLRHNGYNGENRMLS